MLHPREPLITGVLLAGMILPGCRGTTRVPPLSRPVVTIELANLTASERRVVAAYMQHTADRQWQVEHVSAAGRQETTGEQDTTAPGDASDDRQPRTVTYRVHLDSWADHEALHRGLASLRDTTDGHLILQNHAARANLAYTSSQAHSQSTAVITIAVSPPAAELHFDTAIPNLEAAGPTRTGRGTYELKLSFSFIKEHDHVYFHSLYKGQYRYYRYHLRAERQELLSAVDGPAAFEEFRARH